MREMVVKCDFCGKKIDMSNWENRCNNLTICHSQSSQNALEKFQKGNFQEVVIDTKDICWHCARRLSNGLANLLDELGYIEDK